MTPQQVEERKEHLDVIIGGVDGLFPDGMNGFDLAVVVRLILAAYGIDGDDAAHFLDAMARSAKTMEADAITQTAIYEAQHGEKP